MGVVRRGRELIAVLDAERAARCGDRSATRGRTFMKRSDEDDIVKLVTFQFGVDLFARRRAVRRARASVHAAEQRARRARRGSKVCSSIAARSFRSSTCGGASSSPTTSITPETRILVLTTADGWVGGIVDAVHEVAVDPGGERHAAADAVSWAVSAEFVQRHREGARSAGRRSRRRARAGEHGSHRVRAIRCERAGAGADVAERLVDELRARHAALDVAIRRNRAPPPSSTR